MHILDEEFRKKLIDKYAGEITTVFNRPIDIFFSVINYLGETEKDIDEVRKLVDALADWTRNPTESELRKILDVEKKVSGYGMTSNADEAIAVIAYCIAHGIQSNVDIVDIGDTSFYKVSFKDVTASQRDAIMKASCVNSKGKGD